MPAVKPPLTDVRIFLTVRTSLTVAMVIMANPARKVEEPVPASASAPQPTKTRYCSFCFMSQHEVRKLISGPANIFICDECVALCNGIIGGNMPSGPKPSPEALPTERLLERLQPIEDTIQGKGNQLQWVVDLLRSREVSWAQIGAALGISRQSAWERFT